MNKTLLLIGFCTLNAPVQAITNIEFVRDQSSGKDFYAQIEASLDGESGNQSTDTLGTSVSLAWDDNGSHFITVLDHLWRKDTGNVEVNQSFAHIRYTKEVKNDSGNHLEFFVQGQRDRFRNIESRVLMGAGYRKTLFNEYNNRFNAFGLGAFFESEESVDSFLSDDHKQWRLSAYWHHKQPINETIRVENVIYLQPSLADASEFRLHDEIRITAEVTKSLSYGFNATYSYNSDPIGDVKRYDMTYGSFLQYSF